MVVSPPQGHKGHTYKMIPNENQVHLHNAEAISSDHGVMGVFGDRSGADSAYDQLIEQGYVKEEINILTAENTKYEFIDKKSPTAAIRKEALVGAAIGLITGSLMAGF